MSKSILFIQKQLIFRKFLNKHIKYLNNFYLSKMIISVLLDFQKLHFQFVLILNKGEKFFCESFFNSQGIFFKKIFSYFDVLSIIKYNNLLTYFSSIEKSKSFVISNKKIDFIFSKKNKIPYLFYNKNFLNWLEIKKIILSKSRSYKISRVTNETNISLKIWLDKSEKSVISTGIGFFDHLLYQISIHANIKINLFVIGDLHIDDHHTVEDTAIVLGKAIKKSLGNKLGINRFGFVLPMDESISYCILDISGRSFLKFDASYKYQYIGNFNTSMVEHFFYSFCNSMQCTLHIKTKGKNDHHKIESLFKVFGRTLKQAIYLNCSSINSSKGIL